MSKAGGLNDLKKRNLLSNNALDDNEVSGEGNFYKSETKDSNKNGSSAKSKLASKTSTNQNAASTQKALAKNIYENKKNAVFDKEINDNITNNLIKSEDKTSFNSHSSKQLSHQPTSLQIEEIDKTKNRFRSIEFKKEEVHSTPDNNVDHKTFSIESEEYLVKKQLPYNNDLSKRGNSKNIILTSDNLFDEENIDYLNTVLDSKETQPIENFDSENVIRNPDSINNTLNETEEVKSKPIIPEKVIIDENDRINEVPETVIINKALIMSTVNVSAMKIKPNGKYVETDVASRTHAIQVNFNLSKNSFSTAGNKEVHIIIQNPKDKVINEKGTFMMNNGQEMPFTDQTVTYYNKSNIHVTIMSERFIQKIVKGTYIVKIYIEGELIGMTLLILRG